MVENSLKMGKYMLNGLKTFEKDYDFVQEARGQGMLMALEYTIFLFLTVRLHNDRKINAAGLIDKLFDNKLLCKQAHGERIRICPPINISQTQCDEILEIFSKTLKTI